MKKDFLLHMFMCLYNRGINSDISINVATGR